MYVKRIDLVLEGCYLGALAVVIGRVARPLDLRIEVDAVFVRVPSHVTLVRKQVAPPPAAVCHLHVRSLVSDAVYLLHRLPAIHHVPTSIFGTRHRHCKKLQFSSTWEWRRHGQRVMG